MNEKTQEVEKLQFDVAIFDPNEEALNLIVEEVSAITADPTKITKEELELVNTNKNKLVKARTAIQARGKEARADAIKYQKDVIAYEKKLIGIIEPEEKRLKDINDEAKAHAMREERKKKLPEYKERLDSIGDDITISDDELLEFGPAEFDEYYNGRLQVKLEADKQEAEERKAKEEAEAKAKQEELERKEKELAEKEYNTRAKELLTIGYKESGGDFIIEGPDTEGNQQTDSIPESAVREADDDAYAKIVECAKEIAKKFREAQAVIAEQRKKDEIAEAEKKAREEAEAKAKAEADAKEAEAKAKAEAEQKAKEEAEAKAKAEAEAKAKEDEERAQAEAYQEFLKKHNIKSPGVEFDDYVEHGPIDASDDAFVTIYDLDKGVTRAYKLIGVHQHK